jgi:hypothetical protein
LALFTQRSGCGSQSTNDRNAHQWQRSRERSGNSRSGTQKASSGGKRGDVGIHCEQSPVSVVCRRYATGLFSEIQSPTSLSQMDRLLSAAPCCKLGGF